MSSNNLDKRYSKIISFKKKGLALGYVLRGLVFAVVITISPLINSSQPHDILYWVDFALFLIFSTTLGILYKKQKDYVIDKKKEQFFLFYAAYQSLVDYKEDPKDSLKKKAQKSVNQVLFHVGKWLKMDTPQVFRNELLDMVYSNLGKVVKLIEQERIDDLSSFMDNLRHISEIILSGNEPTLEDWTNFNSSMNSLKLPPESNIPEHSKPSMRGIIAKYVIIGPIMGIILDPILIYEGMKPADALLGSISVAFVAMGAMAGIAMAVQKSKI